MVPKGEKSDEYVACILPPKMHATVANSTLTLQAIFQSCWRILFLFGQFLGSWEQLLGNTANPPKHHKTL